jgi:hypothetical protein
MPIFRFPGTRVRSSRIRRWSGLNTVTPQANLGSLTPGSYELNLFRVPTSFEISRHKGMLYSGCPKQVFGPGYASDIVPRAGANSSVVGAMTAGTCAAHAAFPKLLMAGFSRSPAQHLATRR